MSSQLRLVDDVGPRGLHLLADALEGRQLLPCEAALLLATRGLRAQPRALARPRPDRRLRRGAHKLRERVHQHVAAIVAAALVVPVGLPLAAGQRAGARVRRGLGGARPRRALGARRERAATALARGARAPSAARRRTAGREQHRRRRHNSR